MKIFNHSISIVFNILLYFSSKDGQLVIETTVVWYVGTKTGALFNTEMLKYSSAKEVEASFVFQWFKNIGFHLQ